MTEKELKFADLTTLFGVVEHQITAIDSIIKEVEDKDSQKFLKEEQRKYKGLRTSLNKLIKNY